jgi:predicted Zn-dependent peptidase
MEPALDERGLFPGPVVSQEKEKQRQFIEGLVNDREAYAAERCAREMCKGEPFSVYEHGDVSSLARVTPESVTACWRGLVAGSPIDVFALGAFDEAAGRELLREAFSQRERSVAPLRGTTPGPEKTEPREVRERIGINQAKLCMGLRTGTRIGDDGYFGLGAMNGVLGAFPHSKLFRNVREKAGLCYYASSSIERTKGLLFIQSGIDAERFESARDLCLAQIDAIARGDVSDEEITNTALALRHGYRSLLDRPSQLASAFYVLRMGGRKEPLAEVALRMESATRDEIVAAARRVRLDTVYLLEPDGSGGEGGEGGVTAE